MKTTWPSPAEEELTDSITLDQYLIRNRAASFLLTISGEAMRGSGIFPGDLVVVERGKAPQNGDIVVATVDGAWVIRRFERVGPECRLVADNAAFPPITSSEELRIDGVVTGVARRYFA